MTFRSIVFYVTFVAIMQETGSNVKPRNVSENNHEGK